MTSSTRRRFLTTAGLAAAVGAALPTAGALAVAEGPSAVRTGGGRGRLPTDLFTLGVASGDPLPDGIVLWTRLAPRPTDGGGMPDRVVPVHWELAEDERFARVRARGVTAAAPQRAHSVHVDVRGLAPGRPYYYRFRAGGEISPVGRTATAPARGAAPRRLRFAVASCQNLQDGYYTALQHLVAEPDLAFVAFLGDYIYETAPHPGSARVHEGVGEPMTLTEYRNRYGQYKSDPDLQAAHAALPWIATFDDHEVDNNWAGQDPQDPGQQSPAMFRARRAAAFAAYYEHLPLRPASVPRGPQIRVYRRMRFGDLAALHVLDTRQYRSGRTTTMEQADDPARTMTGAAQEYWLTRGMATSGARWNLLANQVMWAQSDRLPGPGRQYDFDSWDGARVQRRRLLEFFGGGAVRNPVVLTGDRHRTWVSDLQPDFDDPRSPVVSTEITGTSITSGGDEDNAAFHAGYDQLRGDNPHWRYFDARRGYLVCDLSGGALDCTLRTVDTVRARSASVTSPARFVVEDGRPGVLIDRNRTQ